MVLSRYVLLVYQSGCIIADNIRKLLEKSIKYDKVVTRVKVWESRDAACF